MSQNHLECFFVPPEQVSNDCLIISGNEFRHLQKVKRKRTGDQIQVTDGDGNFYTVKLNQIKATQATAEIVKKQRLVGEPLVSITLAQGLIRSQKMDWIIEKGTELGVKKIIPVETDFSRLKPSELKYSRWEKIAQSAIKQCGRSCLPQIEKIQKVNDLLENLSKPVFFAHPGIKKSVHDVISDLNRKRTLRALSLLIGPEGGFSEDEVVNFKEWGFHQVQLGNRRLRSETAALTLIALTLEALNEI
jgi:16S rRNA (uracil1498-N3)-methyltransferase